MIKLMDDNAVQSPLPPRRVIEEVETIQENTVQPPPETLVSSEKEPEVEKKKLSLPIKPLLIIGLLLVLGWGGWQLLSKLGGGSGGGDTVITYWGLWENSNIVQGIIADFESKNPGIKINYVENQKNDYRTRLAGRLEKDTSQADVPDIFRIHSSWWPMFSDKLALVPEKTAENIGLETDFYEAYKNTLKQKGQFWAVPLMYDGLSMFYNKDLLESASVGVPKSWWDLQTAANKLTVRDEEGRIKVAGAALGLVENVDHWSDIIGLMMAQNGVNPLLGDEKNNTKLQDVLTFYTLFYTRDTVWDESMPDSTTLFANGKLGFYFGPSWRVFNIEDKKIPNLRYEITTVPQLPTRADVVQSEVSEADLTNIHWATFWAEGVNKNSKKQKEAWKFLEFLAQKENLEKLYQAASQTRAFGEIYPRISMQEMMMQNPKTAPFAKAANDASGWYLSSRTFDGVSGINDGMIKYFADAINGIVVKKMAPEAVMTDLRNGIEQLKVRFKL